MKLVEIAQKLHKNVPQLSFTPPVTHVYNLLDYAWALRRGYLECYSAGHSQVALAGMNPGLFSIPPKRIATYDPPAATRRFKRVILVVTLAAGWHAAGIMASELET